MAIGKALLKDKDKPKKQKKKTTTQLKKKLDEIFSRYIRLKYSNNNGEARCYTCGVQKHWTNQQCGHFVSRTYLATRFLEENVRVQCAGCNIFGGGRTVVFANKLDAEKPETVKNLYRKAQEITKSYPYEEKIQEYSQKVEELMYETKGYA
jgi:hypothetical protein